MGTQNWYDNTGLFRQYGTDKAVAETAGEYMQPGAYREVELTIDLTSLTTSAVIQSNNLFFPANVFVEEIVVDTEVGMTVGSATAFSVGLMKTDRTTTISDTQFLSSVPNADVTTAGQKKSYTVGVSGVGAGVGSSSNTFPGYITAKSVGGTYTAGRVKVRIRYRGIGTITF